MLYKKGLGFNKFPGENPAKLKESILEIFKIFPDDTQVFPGHGESASVGMIRSNNFELAKFLN